MARYWHGFLIQHTLSNNALVLLSLISRLAISPLSKINSLHEMRKQQTIYLLRPCFGENVAL